MNLVEEVNAFPHVELAAPPRAEEVVFPPPPAVIIMGEGDGIHVSSQLDFHLFSSHGDDGVW